MFLCIRLYILEMDEAERKQKYNYERHNYPLSQVDYEGETFADYSADPFAYGELFRRQKIPPRRENACNLYSRETYMQAAKIKAAKSI